MNLTIVIEADRDAHALTEDKLDGAAARADGAKARKK